MEYKLGKMRFGTKEAKEQWILSSCLLIDI